MFSRIRASRASLSARFGVVLFLGCVALLPMLALQAQLPELTVSLPHAVHQIAAEAVILR